MATKKEYFDKLNQKIEKGDVVVYVHRMGYGTSIGQLEVGKVVGFTPKFVKIQVDETFRKHVLKPARGTLIMKDEYIKRIMFEKMRGNSNFRGV